MSNDTAHLLPEIFSHAVNSKAGHADILLTPENEQQEDKPKTYALQWYEGQPERYEKGSRLEGGRWVTMPADGEGGSGTPVYIKDDRVVAGPAALKDRDLDDIDQDLPDWAADPEEELKSHAKQWEKENIVPAPRNKLDKAAVEIAGSRERGAVEAVKEVIQEVHKAKQDEIDKYNNALKETMAQVGISAPGTQYRLFDLIKKVSDFEELKNYKKTQHETTRGKGRDQYDVMVDYAQEHFPGIIGPAQGESAGKGDYEQGLFEALQRGFEKPIKPHDEEVLDEVVKWMARYALQFAVSPQQAARLIRYHLKMGEGHVLYRYAQMTLWDESDHPRDAGGKFTSTPGSGGKEAKKKTPTAKTSGGWKPAMSKAEAVEKASGDSTKERLNYKQATHATYLYTGTNPSDWSAAAIDDFQQVDDGQGNDVTVPVFDLPSGYQQVETPWSAEDACGLCGAKIKHHYHIQNDKEKLTMNVGSECVTHFADGKSGKQLAKEEKQKLNRNLIGDAWALRQRIADAFGDEYSHRDVDKPAAKLFEHDVRRATNSEGYRKDYAKRWGVTPDEALEVIKAGHELENMLHTSKGYPVLDEPRKIARRRRDSSGYWTRKQTPVSYVDTATDAAVTRWAKKNGDRLRDLMTRVDEIMENRSQ